MNYFHWFIFLWNVPCALATLISLWSLLY